MTYVVLHLDCDGESVVPVAVRHREQIRSSYQQMPEEMRDLPPLGHPHSHDSLPSAKARHHVLQLRSQSQPLSLRREIVVQSGGWGFFILLVECSGEKKNAMLVDCLVLAARCGSPHGVGEIVLNRAIVKTA